MESFWRLATLYSFWRTAWPALTSKLSEETTAKLLICWCNETAVSYFQQIQSKAYDENSKNSRESPRAIDSHWTVSESRRRASVPPHQVCWRVRQGFLRAFTRPCSSFKLLTASVQDKRELFTRRQLTCKIQDVKRLGTFGGPPASLSLVIRQWFTGCRPHHKSVKLAYL